MRAFTKTTGRVAVLDRPDIDTDQIVSKQVLKRIDRTGYGKDLFYDWRFDADGNPRADFPLNWPAYANASILVAARNFGCGSSREHAVWAIQEYGFDVVIAPSFGDIFRTNAGKNGLLAVVLPDDEVKALMSRVDHEHGSEMTVDLETNTIVDPSGREIAFEIEEATRYRLLNGLDDIALTLLHEEAIAAYEKTHGIA